MIAALTAPIEMPATQSISMDKLLKALDHAGLKGTQRAAALQHQRDLAGERQWRVAAPSGLPSCVHGAVQ